MNDASTQGTASVVSLRVDGDVAVIDIDDGKANALSFDLLADLNTALDDIESSAKAVVIVGREGKFSAGFNLTIMQSSPAAARDLLGAGAQLGLRLYEFPIPVVLGVTGHALAMGGILLCCADVRIGADGPFKLGLNEVGIGMPVPRFAVEICRDRLAPEAYTRAIQLAHIHTPQEARDAGFLDEVVEPSVVAERAVEVAQDLAGWVHPGPFRLTRSNIRGALARQIRDDLDADLAEFDIST